MLKKDTISVQQKLAKYCRTGKDLPIEGSLPNRLPHYRRLVYNVMYGLLEKAFPIIKSILSEPEFKSLVDAYLIDHNAQEPQVWKVPGEFYSFLKVVDHPVLDVYPYLVDLALLEWSEILLFNQEEKPNKNYDNQLFSYLDNIVLNPDYRILDFSYPIHKGDFEEINNKKGAFILLGFRNNSTKKVHFIEISALHKQLISILESGLNLKNALDTISKEFRIPNDEGFEKSIRAFLTNLKRQGFVLGRSTDQ